MPSIRFGVVNGFRRENTTNPNTQWSAEAFAVAEDYIHYGVSGDHFHVPPCSQEGMSKLKITRKTDTSRLRCPYNHSSVGPTNHHFYCHACANSHDPDVDPEFDKVRDAKTGMEYSRDEVVLNFDLPGVYYA